MRWVNAESAMDAATLFDWYISSVGKDPPVWTEEHLDELLRDFLVIPIDTPTIDAPLVTHGMSLPELPGDYDQQGYVENLSDDNNWSRGAKDRIRRLAVTARVGLNALSSELEADPSWVRNQFLKELSKALGEGEEETK